jgi:hypothetical protein
MKKNASRPAASGRFLLRIAPGLHAALRRAAAAAGLSLKDYCARKLASPVGNQPLWFAVGDAVQRAASVFGEALIGIVAFGSWARGELHGGSDVDLLVVVDEEVGITRHLYRRWDEAQVRWNGHEVEPHFVHLAQAEARCAGLWAEVAMDGIVLFARDLDLPARLAGIRRDVADGRILRKVANGQPYWVQTGEEGRGPGSGTRGNAPGRASSPVQRET